MYSGKNSLTELAQQLEADAAAKVDYVADTHHITMALSSRGFDDDELRPVLAVEQEMLRPTEHCHGQIAQWTGIGKRYYEKIRADSPALLAGNVNHWLHKPDIDKRRMVRTMDGVARAFLSDKFLRIDNEHVAEATFKALEAVKDQSDINLLSCEITDRRLYLKFAFPNVEGEVLPGDAVQSGVIVRNSEIGMGSFEVYPFLYRLVCKNGMMGYDSKGFGIRRRHVGGTIRNEGVVYQQDTIEKVAEGLLLECRDAITTYADRDFFTKQLNALREAAEVEPIERPVKGVERLAKSKGFDFTETEQESILECLLRDGDYTKWGLANAVTNVANTAREYDRASELEAAGGRIIELNRRDWDYVRQAA